MIELPIGLDDSLLSITSGGNRESRVGHCVRQYSATILVWGRYWKIQKVNIWQLPYTGKYMTATLHINALLNKLHLFYTYSKITLPPGN